MNKHEVQIQPDYYDQKRGDAFHSGGYDKYKVVQCSSFSWLIKGQIKYFVRGLFMCFWHEYAKVEENAPIRKRCAL